MTYENALPAGDYHFDMNHRAFSQANVLFKDGSDGKTGISSHETAIGGILVGSEPNAHTPQQGHFFYLGAVPKAEIDVYEFWNYMGLNIFYNQSFTAQIATISLGEFFPSWWTRGIEKIAQKTGLVVFAAAGNGKNAYTSGVLYPAAGANVIAVGVINSIQDPNNPYNASFSTPNSKSSSTGPTSDMRCKPDIVAPGKCLVPLPDSSNSYSLIGDWSSLATPVASGAAALLLQKAKSDPTLTDAVFYGNTNNVIKSLLMTSAIKLPYWHKGLPGAEDDVITPLDYIQGAGALNVLEAYTLLTMGNQAAGTETVSDSGWDNNQLNPRDNGNAYTFHIADPNRMVITATLCWNRVYKELYPFEPDYENDSDLTLELWGVDPNDPSQKTLLDFSDSINDNVEHIYLAADHNYMDYRLVVRFSTTGKIFQPYALSWMTRPDSLLDNPFWYDLNNDGQINSLDKLIYSVVDQGKVDFLNHIYSALNLSEQRMAVLESNWNGWKSRLGKWNNAHN